MGAWSYIAPRLDDILGDKTAALRRPQRQRQPGGRLAQSPRIEQRELVEQAFTI